MNILSIDAWRTPDGGWTWNQWYSVGSIDQATFDTLTTTRSILRWMRNQGLLNAHSAGRVELDDDGYNLVICDRRDHRPLFAIEYGAFQP